VAPKPRNTRNTGHPKGWRWKNGAWRYRVPKGLESLWDGRREFTLGRTEAEAYKAWSDRLQLQRHARTIADLLDRYAAQVVPTKAPKTQEANRAGLARLRKVFGHMLIGDLKPMHVYGYADARSDAPVSAHRDIEVLSHAYTKAIEWGLTEAHPVLGKVRLQGTRPRDRYVTDEELAAALAVAQPVIRAYIAIKLLTGLRRGDILRLTVSDLRDDGIHVRPNKTAKTTRKRLIIEWTDELRQAVDYAKAARPKDLAPHLFCTGKGRPYVKEDGRANGFDSLWQRFMGRAMRAGLQERFQERDLRAKTASDMPLELASALLGHADPRLTQRVYRRRPDLVRPGKSGVQIIPKKP
jgi:integrase